MDKVKNFPDFRLQGNPQDSVFLLVPVTKQARLWVAEHLPEDTARFADGYCVEHSYIGAILGGIQSDGLTVRDRR